MARRVTKRERLLVSAGLHPEYREVINTYLMGLDDGKPKVDVVPLDEETGATDTKALQERLTDDVAAVLIGYPNFFGVVEDFQTVSDLAIENHISFSSIYMRRCSIQFKELKAEEKAQLAKFIKHYTAYKA